MQNFRGQALRPVVVSVNIRLHVYERALVAVKVCEPIARGIMSVRYDLTDQLRRASSSIPLNIAEGSGEFSIPAKISYYRNARRSTWECLAIMDVIDLVVDDHPPTAIARSTLNEVSALITKTILANERRRSE